MGVYLIFLVLKDRAIQRLERVEFWRGEMTGEQLTAILTMAKERKLGRIETIRIALVDGMSSVSTSLLQEARQNIKLNWICLVTQVAPINL